MACDYSCLLCGIGILSMPLLESQYWLREYRIIYRKSQDGFISGVGCFDDVPPWWTVPVDPLLRWDTDSDSNDQLAIPIMRQPAAADNGIHGFLLHDACWNLLLKACDPTDNLSLERLVSVCESLPFPPWYNGVCWGHDYGGLLRHDLEGSYPWLERFSSYKSITDIHNMGAWDDPFQGSAFRTMSTSITVSHTFTTNNPIQSADSTDDRFSQLPWELREKILVCLPTKDALNLRRASRSFLPLFSSFAFWLSRFEPDGERGFLFEAREVEEVRNVDVLLYLYRFSRRSVATPGLLNRERVWSLARKLVVLIIESSSPANKNMPSQRVSSSDSSRKWIRLAGQEHPSVSLDKWKAFDSGCRSTTTIYIKIAYGTVRIGITVTNMGAWDYITAIRFVNRGGNEQIVGYAYDKNNEVVCDVTALHGFRVAMGPGGIRALQVFGKERQQASKWAGRTDGVPQSDRLVMDAPLASLSVSLDGYKITALAVSVRKADTNQSHTATLSFPTILSTISLRQAAFWYPNIPPDELLLNEESFTGQDPLSSGYRPLSWIHFGGPAGKSLDQIQGILVQSSSYGLHSLQLVYDEEIHGRRCSDKLGRCNEQELPYRPLFLIDGAGGERIDSIYVETRRTQDPNAPDFIQAGILERVKFITNRGRTMWIGKQTNKSGMRPLRIAHGTVITGLYGHQDLMYGIISLGVISERTVYPT